ncbi:hypothetical protein CF326_g6860 [Tilletia indica]|nr:hypothetical protein CF326_g6860 [Tilletia indica]
MTGTAQTVRRGGKTTTGDLTEKSKDRSGGTKDRHPQEQLAAGAPRPKATMRGTERRTVTGQGTSILRGQVTGTG